MRSSPRLSLIGLLTGAVLAAGLTEGGRSSGITRHRRSNASPRTLEQQRYRGMTEEQRAWNLAVDEKRAAKR